jgi:hypothetical protein
MSLEMICKMKGGSHSYGLNTDSSDEDFRGVFLNTEIKTIIGLDRHEHQQNQGNGVDEVYTELRNFFKLLRQGNTQAIELLYNDDWIWITDSWKLIQSKKESLMDCEKLFNCLRGYMQGELKLALGERTGKLGGKRFEQLQKFGFSPKNAVQLVRLAWAGCIYFKKGYFPVRIDKEDKQFAEELLGLKTHPEKFTKENVKELGFIWEQKLLLSYETREVHTVFDDDLANDLCFQLYAPFLKSYQFLPFVLGKGNDADV